VVELADERTDSAICSPACLGVGSGTSAHNARLETAPAATPNAGWRHVLPGGRARVLPAGEAVLEEIEVTCVASGLVDHVDEDPPKVDRADPERGNRGDVVE
jgi:hypothetical protein